MNFKKDMNSNSSSTPKWKKFEQLIHNVQSALSPDAKVSLNDKIIGRKSRVERQIDISVRKKVGQFEMLIILDCKDYKAPLDVKDIEEFIGLVEDVGANKGALVSASGFSKAAKTRGKESGIDLFTLVDAEDHEWRTYVAIPMVCDFRSLRLAKFFFRGSSEVLSELSNQDPRLIKVFDKEHKEIGTPITLLQAKWNKREISDKPGSYTGIDLSTDSTFVRSSNGTHIEVAIEATCIVEQRLYFGYIPLTKVTGLRDEISGNLTVPGKTEIITDWIDISEVEHTWVQIPSIDALAIKPITILTALDQYPLDSQLP